MNENSGSSPSVYTAPFPLHYSSQHTTFFLYAVHDKYDSDSHLSSYQILLFIRYFSYIKQHEIQKGHRVLVLKCCHLAEVLHSELTPSVPSVGGTPLTSLHFHV